MSFNYEKDSPKHHKTFSSVGSDQDLTSAANAGAEMAGSFARWITIGGAGTVVVVNQNDEEITFPGSYPSGHYWFGQFKTLKSTSTATDIVVYW